MTDIRADDLRADDLDEGDRLPWLEAVDDEKAEGGPSALKLIAWVIIGLVAIGGIVGGLFWLGNRHSGPSHGVETIAAAPAPYKVKPAQPGGMHVDGEGDTAFAASAGAAPKGKIDMNAVPETPVTRHPAPVPAKAAPQPAARPGATTAIQTAKAAPKPKPVPAAAPVHAGPGGNIQLGAFSSGAAAEKAWKALSGRFTYLAPLAHNVVSVEAGGKTLYRLRASGPDAGGICGRLKVAGETCVKLD